MTSTHDERALPETPVPPVADGSVGTVDRTNTLAIASFALALSGLTILAQIAGIVTGHIALKQIRASGERGHELAKWGLIISYIVAGASILLAVFFVAIWGIMFASMLTVFGTGDMGGLDMLQYSDSF